MTRAGRLDGHPGITGDVERLPLRSGAVDAAVSSLTLQWALDLDAALAELARVLRPGGVLVAATLARGTLPELDHALRRVDGAGGVGPFLPRERMAAALAGAGLRDAECRTEEVVLEADSPRAVLRDLKGLGAVDKTPGRRRGLRGRDRIARLEAAYRAACNRPAGPVPVTWQVTYLVGRCPS
jgi:malonyl-CoA O-methyltransferase